MNKRFSSVLRPHAVPHWHCHCPSPPPHQALHRKAFSLNLLCFWPCLGANNKRQVHTATPSAHALAGTLHQQQATPTQLSRPQTDRQTKAPALNQQSKELQFTRHLSAALDSCVCQRQQQQQQQQQREQTQQQQKPRQQQQRRNKQCQH